MWTLGTNFGALSHQSMWSKRWAVNITLTSLPWFPETHFPNCDISEVRVLLWSLSFLFILPKCGTITNHNLKLTILQVVLQWQCTVQLHIWEQHRIFLRKLQALLSWESCCEIWGPGCCYGFHFLWSCAKSCPHTSFKHLYQKQGR